MKHPFAYHAPTPEQVSSIQAVREACADLYSRLLVYVPPSRERSLAITKLEEISMWANKGIVMQENQRIVMQENIE